MQFLKEPKTVSIIGAPLALGQSLAGVELAPDTLRQEGLSRVIEELGWQVYDTGNMPFDFPRDQAAEAGQVGVKFPNEVGKACRSLKIRTANQARAGNFCLTLGGDHSLAIGTVSGIREVWEDVALVWVDAHGDCNTPETSPSGHLHGMPLAALLGYIKPGTLPGFDWLTGAINPARVALVGVRSLDPGERVLLRSSGVKVFTMTEVDRYGIGRVMDMAMEYINPDGKSPYHLSMDIDALDPYLAPSTGTKARGGLSYREAHFVAEALAETGQLVAMDLVEINPLMAHLEGSPHGWSEPGEKPDVTVEVGVELIASALGKRIL